MGFAAVCVGCIYGCTFKLVLTADWRFCLLYYWFLDVQVQPVHWYLYHWVDVFHRAESVVIGLRRRRIRVCLTNVYELNSVEMPISSGRLILHTGTWRTTSYYIHYDLPFDVCVYACMSLRYVFMSKSVCRHKIFLDVKFLNVNILNVKISIFINQFQLNVFEMFKVRHFEWKWP